MSKLSMSMVTFAQQQRGVAFVEYIVIAAVLTAGSVFAIQAYSSKNKSQFCAAAGGLSAESGQHEDCIEYRQEEFDESPSSDPCIGSECEPDQNQVNPVNAYPNEPSNDDSPNDDPEESPDLPLDCPTYINLKCPNGMSGSCSLNKETCTVDCSKCTRCN